MELGDFDWIGASGRKYQMKACSLDTLVKPNICGNYIFGEMYRDTDGLNKIRAIYIGEGILKERIEYRINEGRVQRKGCNCFCAMVNEDEKRRKEIEEDLLAANPNSYEPNGCNIRYGG